MAEPADPPVQLQQLCFQILRRQQVPVDRVRWLGQGNGVEHVGLVVEDSGIIGLGNEVTHVKPLSHAQAGGCWSALLGRFEGLYSGVAVHGVTGCAVNVVTGTGGVVPDLLGEELFACDGLSVALVGVVVGVTFRDELVAFGEAFESPFGSGAVEHEIAERRLQLGEAAVLFALEVLLAEVGVEDLRVVNETVT